MKIFISCPFTGLCKENEYEVKDEFKNFFQELTTFIKESGNDYYLAIEREDWGKLHKGPEECTLSDYNAVKDTDMLIVIPGNKYSKGISGGVHVELGWATALNKKMHILIEENFVYSPVVMGLNVLSETKYHICNTFLDNNMLNKIKQIIFDEMEK